MAADVSKFRRFVQDVTRLVERHGGDEPRLLDEGAALLVALVRNDDWLPEEFARPSPESYRQYLLHCDPLESFSVVSFVWMPGQKTPIHDHTVWGLVGVMRGQERPVLLEGGGASSASARCGPFSSPPKESSRTKRKRGQSNFAKPAKLL
ncbi:MAG: hypothetical protein ACT4P3_03120 [Betaproteobacteria bacterium]